MRELAVELKQLRLHGMASAWSDLVEQGGGGSAIESARWLLEHLLQAETTDRAMRSVSHQMHAAKFPVHRDLAGFDFEGSPVDRKLILALAELAFTEQTQNVVLVGGPGTGKTHLATAIGVSGITRHGKRVRFYSTVDLVNALEQEKAQGKAGGSVAIRKISPLCPPSVASHPGKFATHSVLAEAETLIATEPTILDEGATRDGIDRLYVPVCPVSRSHRALRSL